MYNTIYYVSLKIPQAFLIFHKFYHLFIRLVFLHVIKLITFGGK